MNVRQHSNVRRCGRILDRSVPLQLDDLPWHDVGKVELDPETVHCLVYMRDVEGFTNRDLVGLSDHPATRSDPLIARFLGIWRSEEAGHADALDRYLRAYATARQVPVPDMQAPPPSVASAQEKVTVTVTRPVGHVVTAAHMVWGAVNELMTLTGYRLLSRLSPDPVLGELLARIAAQESRHYGFYFLQAEWRLASSRLARTIVPRLVERTWTPVGVGDEYKSRDDFDRVLRVVAQGDSRTAASGRTITTMDETIRRLAGFGRSTLYSDAVAAAA